MELVMCNSGVFFASLPLSVASLSLAHPALLHRSVFFNLYQLNVLIHYLPSLRLPCTYLTDSCLLPFPSFRCKQLLLFSLSNWTQSLTIWTMAYFKLSCSLFWFILVVFCTTTTPRLLQSSFLFMTVPVTVSAQQSWISRNTHLLSTFWLVPVKISHFFHCVTRLETPICLSVTQPLGFWRINQQHNMTGPWQDSCVVFLSNFPWIPGLRRLFDCPRLSVFFAEAGKNNALHFFSSEFQLVPNLPNMFAALSCASSPDFWAGGLLQPLLVSTIYLRWKMRSTNWLSMADQN